MKTFLNFFVEVYLIIINLIRCIIYAYKSGGLKYGFGNLTCELRRGNHWNCYSYQRRLHERFLHSLGVFLMDPFLNFWKLHLNYNRDLLFLCYQLSNFDSQYLAHPFLYKQVQKYLVYEISQAIIQSKGKYTVDNLTKYDREYLGLNNLAKLIK